MSANRSEVEKNTQSDVENAVACASHSQPAVDQFSSPIQNRLDIDCFEELFEWLSIADLRALRQTCKRLQQVVDFFIKTNYPAVKIGCGFFDLYAESDVNEFKELDAIKANMIKEISLDDEMFDEKVQITKWMFPKLEGLRIYLRHGCEQINIFESIFKWCTNLKYLQVQDVFFEKQKPDEGWHQLPTVEHFEIVDGQQGNTEPGSFLQMVPNIRIFTITNSNFLELCADYFLRSNTEIDLLVVHTDNLSVPLCNVFNQLYENGFHKRLHLFVDYLLQPPIDRIASIRGMEKIYFYYGELNPLPTMPHLKELCFDDYTRVENVNDYSRLANVDLVSVAKNFVNLERVYFRVARTDEIIPFIRHARNVNEIKVDDLRGGAHFENEIIQLSALNKERKGLTGACKMTIYVNEDAFLSTKFATTKTELDSIILKRAEAAQDLGVFFYECLYQI